MREVILAELELLSSPSAQLAYETSLTRGGHAPSELISRFCDDLFRPCDLAHDGSFRDDEIKDLAHLYGLIVEASRTQHETVAAMLKDSAWRKVVALAKELCLRLGRFRLTSDSP